MASPMRAIWESGQEKAKAEAASPSRSSHHSPKQRSSTTPPLGESPPLAEFINSLLSDTDEEQPSTSTTTRSRRRNRSRTSAARRSLAHDDREDAFDTALAHDGNAEETLQSMTISNNMLPSFLDTSSLNPGPNSVQRPAPMASQQQQHQVNGTGSGMNGLGGAISNGSGGLPMNAGQQMDVNMLYQKVVELSDVLRENRERTQAIVAGAEELATRAAANGASPSLQEANAEISAARIADLERQLAREQNKTRTMLREQKENTKLIGEYETAVGNIVEMVRNYSFNNKAEKTSLQLHYNKLLQEEKDAHLEARLEKDHWHSRFMRSVEMLRKAYRLRCEEEEVPIKIVAGLQNEVRAFRNALGMEKERPEDEFGWEILKDVVDRGEDP